jgi:hypothetical protein
MKKLALDLDSLDVQSFVIGHPFGARRGTVGGRATEDPYTAPLPDTLDANTCGAVTCRDTCGMVCDTAGASILESCVDCADPGTGTAACPDTGYPYCPLCTDGWCPPRTA